VFSRGRKGGITTAGEYSLQTEEVTWNIHQDSSWPWPDRRGCCVGATSSPRCPPGSSRFPFSRCYCSLGCDIWGQVRSRRASRPTFTLQATEYPELSPQDREAGISLPHPPLLCPTATCEGVGNV